MKAIEDDKLTWNHVSDLKGWQNAAAQLYCVNGIPHLVVLDENNVIVAKDLRGEELQNKVAELLSLIHIFQFKNLYLAIFLTI